MRGWYVGLALALAAASLVCLLTSQGRLRRVQLEGVRGQRSTQLWSGELGAGLDDRVPSRMIDSGKHSVMSRASSEILPGYAGGSTFLTEIGLKPANAAAAAKHSRMAHGPGWQDVQIATPHKSLVHTSARELTVPGLSTVIGAYKEISHLVDGASSMHGVMSMRKGEDAAESLERAADSLDSISASMRKDSKPSKAKLARIATSLSGISSTLVGGVHSPWPHAQGSGLASQEMNTLAENVHEHAAQLLGSHFAVLAGNGTENSANRTGDVGPSPMWGSFETNKDGSILLNPREIELERSIWQRLFGNRLSHGFCQHFYGHEQCAARAEGRWNYDSNTLKLVDPHLGMNDAAR